MIPGLPSSSRIGLTVSLLTLGAIAHGGVTGHWDYDNGDLRATIGAPIEFIDSPTGATAQGTKFDSTANFKIAAIAGQKANVMFFPQMRSPNMGYVVTHGAAPNGGGARVNQYTVILDVLYPSASSEAFRSLFQTDNRGSGDFFVNRGNGIGISGEYAGNVTPDVWHRLAFAVDLTSKVPTVGAFVDGTKVAQQPLESPRDGRWSLGPTFYLLNDAEGESRAGYMNSLQVRDRVLSDAQVTLLGGPTAGGIPTNDFPEHPYVEWTIPEPDAWMVPEKSIIQAAIADGLRPLETNTIRLSLNGRNVLPAISRSGRETTLTYQPPLPLDRATNVALLSFSDTTVPFKHRWQFITQAQQQKPAVTGQWDFDRTNLAPTIGLSLRYLDGPDGASKAAIRFETTTAFGIPDIKGVAAHVLRFAGASTRTIGLVAPHGATPNGRAGATRVNEWTLIIDILVPSAAAEEWFALLQTDAANNSNADLFLKFLNGRGGIGTMGEYDGRIPMSPGRWHRLAFVMDAGAATLDKYIDGQHAATQALRYGGLDSRYSLGSTAILFADEDADSQVAYINSIQFRNYRMQGNEISALGGPAAAGIPVKMDSSD